MSIALRLCGLSLSWLVFSRKLLAPTRTRHGGEGYRQMLIDSISMHDGAHIQSKRVLGDNHPLTRKIVAAFLKCFDEQLDWSLDDIPSDYLAYRARLQLVGGYL